MAALAKLLGFAPDADPTTPGVILDCTLMLPSIRGMKAAPQPVNAGMPALPRKVLGGATVVKLDNTKRLIVGTATDLYEEVTGAWVPVTRASGPYTSSDADTWRFAQFGNETIATNGADVLQQSLVGAFEDIPDGIAGVTITDPGSGYTSNPGVTFSDGGGSGASANAFVNGDGVGEIIMTNAGSGYTGTPIITVDGPAGTATAMAIVADGEVTNVVVADGGTGYTTVPAVTFVGGGGSGAAATAVLTAGVVTSIAGVSMGTGYTSAPTVLIDPPAGTRATATPVMGKTPVAKIVETVAGFVFAFNTTDPIYGVRPNGWWCSGIYDQTVWVPAESTQCENGVMIDTPGDIRAGRALGPDIVVYKETSMYYGTYQGPPVVWAFPCISTQIGAPCQEAVVSIGTAHLFLGNDNFYMFDGTRPTPIGDDIKSWFFADQNPQFVQTVRTVHDRVNRRVTWYYVSNRSTGAIDSGVVFNYLTNKWGRANRAIECAVDFINGQITWASLGTIANEWEDLPQVPYNSPFWTSVATQPSIIDTNHTIQTLTGAAGDSSITTGDFGDDEQYTLFQYLRLRCAQDPASATMTTQQRFTLGGQFTPGVSAPLFDGKFDVDVSARYHRAVIDFSGDVEMIGYSPTLVPDGLA